MTSLVPARFVDGDDGLVAEDLLDLLDWRRDHATGRLFQVRDAPERSRHPEEVSHQQLDLSL